MSDPIKIRATLQGELTDIRVLMQHPMETGQRKDAASGKLVPSHFIQTFLVSANGKPLVDGQLNTSVSKNPVFATSWSSAGPTARVKRAATKRRSALPEPSACSPGSRP